MTTECVDLRQGDRFIMTDPLGGTFGQTEVVILNISVGGMQLMHANPLRIGTRGRITFRFGDLVVATAAHVVWSRVAKAAAANGLLYYHSGIKLDAPDSTYALAIHGIVKNGAARQDLDSLDRKRRRIAEREQERAAQKLRPVAPTAKEG